MARYDEEKVLMFGRFKIETADKLTLKDTKDLAKVLNFSASKIDQIEHSENPGLTFLNTLEKNLQIGSDIGVDQLLDALKEINLLQVADFAEQKFQEFNGCHQSATASSERNVQKLSEIPVDTRTEQKALLRTLRDELTKKECFELATYFGWPAGVVDNIRSSDCDYAELLIENLYRRHINISRVDLLVRALNDCKIPRVIKLIESSLCETADGRHLATQENSDNGICICGRDAFEELRSMEGDLLCLQCTMCSADWKLLSTGSTPSAHQPRIQKYGETFVYKVPISLILSNLRHELVSNPEELRPGDHIFFRWAFGLLHFHAIYVSRQGNQIEIVHWKFRSILEYLRGTFGFSDHLQEKFISIIREYTPFPSYGIGRVCYDGKADSAALTLARALQMLHKTDEHYNLLQNNCENLAMYCKVGKGFTNYGERVGDIHPLFH